MCLKTSNLHTNVTSYEFLNKNFICLIACRCGASCPHHTARTWPLCLHDNLVIVRIRNLYLLDVETLLDSPQQVAFHGKGVARG